MCQNNILQNLFNANYVLLILFVLFVMYLHTNNAIKLLETKINLVITTKVIVKLIFLALK